MWRPTEDQALNRIIKKDRKSSWQGIRSDTGKKSKGVFCNSQGDCTTAITPMFDAEPLRGGPVRGGALEGSEGKLAFMSGVTPMASNRGVTEWR